jgi:hypothetical protein
MLRIIHKKMLKLTSRFGLMGALFIGLTPLPALSDTASGQGASQGVVINGNNNNVTQVINQTIINRPVNNRPSWHGEDKDKRHKNKHKRKHKRGHGDHHEG